MTANENKDSASVDNSAGCVLICFDGSDGAKEAIRYAGEVLKERTAVVLTVWEHLETWVPYDPMAIGSAIATSIGNNVGELDEIAKDAGTKVLNDGLALAKEAGFTAGGRLAVGSAWRAIVELSEELGASPIVIGGRGMSNASSLLLGSVTMKVIHHTQLPVLVVHEPNPDKKHS